jgi:tRNA (guanine-N7-)-methyltransferase
MFPVMRRLRSFVRREGRITPRQVMGLQTYFTQFGLDLKTGLLDFELIFNRKAPVILEIGFGMGNSLLQMAEENPDNNYIGIDVHRPGVGHLLACIAEKNLKNICVFCEDAVSVLEQSIPDSSLSAIYIFFPDPWPKKRHQKRRLIQPELVNLLNKKLKPAGIVHLATDWEDYAMHMMQVMSEASGWENLAEGGQFTPRPEYRPLTKFEVRGQKLGHGVWDLMFKKVK